VLAVLQAGRVRGLPPEKHGLRFHELGHTAAALAIAAGAHAEVIQERLGHSKVETP